MFSGALALAGAALWLDRAMLPAARFGGIDGGRPAARTHRGPFARLWPACRASLASAAPTIDNPRTVSILLGHRSEELYSRGRCLNGEVVGHWNRPLATGSWPVWPASLATVTSAAGLVGPAQCVVALIPPPRARLHAVSLPGAQRTSHSRPPRCPELSFRRATATRVARRSAAPTTGTRPECYPRFTCLPRC
jgi:hypothetical protein